MKPISRAIPWLVALSLSPAFAGGSASARPRAEIIHRVDTPYNHVFVTEDDRGVRSLYFGSERNRNRQTAVRIGHPEELIQPYVRAAMVALALVDRPERILVVGLGGGAMPMFLRHHLPEAHIDVAELDPGVARVARDYFGFREDKRLKVWVGDGRAFIERGGPRYDVVFLDAYGPRDIPYHLATVELMRAVARRLTPRGVLASNIQRQLEHYPGMVATILAVFPEVHVVKVSWPYNNHIVLGLAQKQALDRAALVALAESAQRQHRLPFDLARLVRQGFAVARGGGGGVLHDQPPPATK